MPARPSPKRRKPKSSPPKRKPRGDERERLIQLVEASGDYIAMADLDGFVTYMNGAARRMVGLGPTEKLDGLHISDFVAPRWKDFMQETMAPLLKKQGWWRGEMQMRNLRTGESVDVVRYSFTITDPKTGKPTALATVTRDVTAARRTERALDEQAALLRAISESTTDLIYAKDRESRTLFANPAVLEVIGKPADQVLGRSEAEWHNDPEQAARIIENDRRIMASGEGETMEEVFTTPGCTPRTFLSKKHPLRDTSGEIIGIVGVTRDITAQKQADEALREREARLSAILNTVADAVISIDQRGLITAANPAAARMFGYTEKELINRPVSMLMPPLDRKEHARGLSRYRRTGRPSLIGGSREVHALRKDGSIFPIELAVSEIGTTGVFTGVLRDVTERRQLEAQVLRIAEDERRRVAADLHDGICQEIVGINYLATALHHELAASGHPLAAAASRIEQALVGAAEHTRQVARGMSPVVADGSGLMHALRELAASIRRPPHLRCVFRCPRPVVMVNLIAGNELFRIAQEALQNALRHSQCSQITLRLESKPTGLFLAIADNGCGLRREPTDGPGMGLRIMRYRAGLIGAHFSIQPRQRGDTEVVCQLPTSIIAH